MYIYRGLHISFCPGPQNPSTSPGRGGRRPRGWPGQQRRAAGESTGKASLSLSVSFGVHLALYRDAHKAHLHLNGIAMYVPAQYIWAGTG